jgi:hypothetical protein
MDKDSVVQGVKYSHLKEAAVLRATADRKREECEKDKQLLLGELTELRVAFAQQRMATEDADDLAKTRGEQVIHYKGLYEQEQKRSNGFWKTVRDVAVGLGLGFTAGVIVGITFTP